MGCDLKTYNLKIKHGCALKLRVVWRVACRFRRASMLGTGRQRSWLWYRLRFIELQAQPSEATLCAWRRLTATAARKCTHGQASMCVCVSLFLGLPLSPSLSLPVPLSRSLGVSLSVCARVCVSVRGGGSETHCYWLTTLSFPHGRFRQTAPALRTHGPQMHTASLLRVWHHVLLLGTQNKSNCPVLCQLLSQFC